MADPLIVLGIGAQKSGTSWLYGYLASHPEVYFRSLKELHYFDRLESGGISAFRARLQRKRAELVNSQQPEPGKIAEIDQLLAETAWPRRLLKGRHDAYLHHLGQGRTIEAVIGEITPAYATCSADTFLQIGEIGPKLRLIYVMRDPLERLWSNVRMYARKSASDGGPAEDTAMYFERFLAGKFNPATKRSDYEHTLGVLARTIPPEQVLVEFYEEMFTDEGTRKITDFIGIAAHAGQLDVRPNLGQRVEFSIENKRRAMEILHPQYEAVRKYMGRLPDAWQKNLKEAA